MTLAAGPIIGAVTFYSESCFQGYMKALVGSIFLIIFGFINFWFVYTRVFI